MLTIIYIIGMNHIYKSMGIKIVSSNFFTETIGGNPLENKKIYVVP